MHRTRLGTLILATGWACFPLALLASSLSLALVGTLLVTLVVTARVPALTFSVDRRMPEEPEAGKPFDVVTQVRAESAIPLFVTETPPARAEVLDTKLENVGGNATLTTTLRVPLAGVASWTTLEVQAQDTRGLVEETIQLPFPTHLPIHPSRDPLVIGETAGRRKGFKPKKSRAISLDFEEEIDRLREFQPGDRLRDIDWVHSAKFDKLVSRLIVQNPILPIVVLLDAGAGMRQATGTPKLRTATQAALGAVGAARQRNLGVGMVTFSERGVESQMRVTANRNAITGSLKDLAGLPTTTLAAPPSTNRPRADADAMEFKPSPSERNFLRAANAFNRQTYASGTPLESALFAVQRVSAHPALVIAIVDVETSPGMALTIANRLATHGHRTAIIGIRSGPHAYRLSEVDDAAAAQLVEWRVNRERARVACGRARIPFTMLNPNVTVEQLQEVIASVA